MPVSDVASAPLSLLLPAPAAARLAEAAAKRGETVQELIDRLVERFLADEGRAAATSADVIERLRQHCEALRARGVTGLWLFGSVVCGDAVPGSDVDLYADFAPDALLSLVGLASLRADLSDLLGRPADLVVRSALRESVRAAAEREALRVL